MVPTKAPGAPTVATPADGTSVSTSQPLFSGTAEANSTVKVYVDGTLVSPTATADTAGAWSLTPSSPLSEASHKVKATATNATGTSPDSAINTFIVDLTAPPAPSVTLPTDGALVNVRQPTFSGTAEKSSKVTVYVDGTALSPTATADASTGAWILTPSSSLADGPHTAKATATDAAGNISLDSAPNTFTLDATAPTAPSVTLPADGALLNVRQPTFSGTAEKSSKVTVYVDGTALATTPTADASTGAWSVPQPTNLGDGSHTVKATATDAYNNTSPFSAINTFTVDATAPAAPSVTSPANGGFVTVRQPIFTGTAEASSTVTVYVDGTALATTPTADATTGAWSVTQPTNLADGSHNVKATATDAAGNTSPISATNTFTVDATAPAAPSVASPANGALLNVRQPTYSGTAEASSKVTVFVDGTALATTATADASTGAWSVAQPTNLLDGSHSVKATATDAAGNTSPISATNTFTVDATAPAAPSVAFPANGAAINTRQPTFTGTAEKSSTVKVYVDGTALATTPTADASTGAWSVPQPTNLGDGSHTVKATATDAANNTSPISAINTFTVDATAPAAPSVASPADGALVNARQPTFSGTAEAGSTVKVYVDGTALATTATADASTGAWSLTQPTNLLDGSHNVKATATDVAGNTSPISAINTFTVDATAPAAPSVASPADGAAITTRQPTFTGTAEKSSTVKVYVDGTALATTPTADASTGAWSVPQPTNLLDGSHTVKATATDAAGNISPDSAINTFIVDLTPPAAPSVTSPTNGGAVNTRRPTFAGTAEAGSTVKVYVDGSLVGTATFTTATAWNFVQLTDLVDGSHTVKANATDAAGNTGPDSATNTFSVDLTPPGAPVVTSPLPNTWRNTQTVPVSGNSAKAGSTVTVFVNGIARNTTTADSSGNWIVTLTLTDGSYTVKATATDPAGNISLDSNTVPFNVDTVILRPVVTQPTNGSLVNTHTPVLQGTAEAYSSISLTDNSTSLGVTTTDSAGNWSFRPADSTPLADGSHTVTATATDLAGNTSTASAPVTFTVDTNAPAVPVVTSPTNNGWVNTPRPPFTGTAEAGSTITLTVDSTVAGTTSTNASNAWSFTPTTSLSEGVHTLTVTATDAAGNTSAASSLISFTVDTTTPAVPVVSSPTANAWVNTQRPTFSGTAEALSTVRLTVDGSALATTVADGSGNWSFTIPSTTPALSEGSHTVTATAADQAGNTSAASAPVSFTVDTIAPTTPVVSSPSNGSQVSTTKPPFSGTAEANTTVSLILDGSLLGTTSANASGAWSFTPSSALTENLHTLKVTATDRAGNTSQPTADIIFTVDVTAPIAPAIAQPTSGAFVKSTRPTFSGTAEANSTIKIFVDGSLAGSAPTSALGAWSFTVPSLYPALSESTHTLTATATDLAGNTGPAASVTFIVDVTAPNAPVLSSPISGALLQSTTVSFTGTAEANSTITILEGGTPQGSTTANGTGSWSLDVTMAQGSHTVTATATDRAGNTSTSSTSVNFTVDTQPPSAPVITQPVNNALLSTSTPTFSGTADPQNTIKIFVDGKQVGTVPSDIVGSWRYTLTGTLQDGSHTVKASATDAANRTSPESTPVTFQVDTTAPGAPVITAPANGGLVNTGRPTFSGTAEAGSIVAVFVDGSAAPAGTATATAGGTWSFALTSSTLSSSTHTAKANATDAAGNVSPYSGVITFTVDTIPPSVPVVTSPTNGALLRQTRPTINGTAEINSQLTLYVNSVKTDSFSTDASGNWTDTLNFDLPQGRNTIRVDSKDSAGNTSSSVDVTFTVDTVPPSTPTVTLPAAVGTTPTYSGTADAGTLVQVYVDGSATPIGTAVSNAQGTWSLAQPTPLSQGSHSVQVTSTDAAGNVSAPSANSDFIVDTQAPEAPLITSLTNGALLNTAKPTFQGTAESGSTVSVFVDGAVVGTVIAVSGNWSFTLTTNLAQGAHKVSATARDNAGNISPSSSTINFSVDSVPPAAPEVTSPVSGSFIATARPTITGNAEPSSKVTVLVDGIVVSVFDADATGKWSLLMPSTLAEGLHRVSATARDAAGNDSQGSAEVLFTVDTVTPLAPVVTSPARNETVGTATPTILGSSDAGNIITLFVDGTEVGHATADAGGHWSYTLTNALAEGPHTLKASATDRAGNVGPATSNIPFIVDTVNPQPPKVTSIKEGDSINDSTPTLAGTAEPRSTITAVVEGQVLTTQADANGNWSVEAEAALSEAPHTATISAMDSVGNTSSISLHFTVDLTPPDTVIAAGSPVLQAYPPSATFDFSSEEGTTFECSFDNADFSTCTSPITYEDLAEGDHSFRVRAKDRAGNIDPEPSTYSWSRQMAVMEGGGCNATGGAASGLLACLSLMLLRVRRRDARAGVRSRPGSCLPPPSSES